MKKGLAALAGLLVLAGAFLGGTAHAASVTPTYVEGVNPTCASVGLPNTQQAGDYSASGVYNLPGGNTITVTVSGDTKTIDWSSTLSMDAVIVKAGNGANVYDYRPGESFGDTGLVTPNNGGQGQQTGLSHLRFCYDYEVGVTKTANTTFTRAWTWSIDKTCDQTSLTLSVGQVMPVNCTVTVGATSADSNYGASGTITIHNPDPSNTATIATIVDQISGLGAPTPVTCPVSLPYVLASGANLVCSYTSVLPDASMRTNTATVTTTGVVGGGSGSANVIFGTPTTLTDECAAVSDTQTTLSPAQLCANVDTLPHVYSYVNNVSYTTCGDKQFVNTATFVTNDTQATGSDTWTVTVNVPCVLGCTLTQGYWKTHSSYGPAPYDNTWAMLANGADTLFYSSGTTWLGVFQTPPKGNPYYILAHQYMAAKLNVLNGASASSISSALVQAEAFFSNPSNTPSTNYSKAMKQQLVALAGVLASYNEGTTGPGHCSE